MRPNIQISHQKNGVVKDLANERDKTLEQMYREIIDLGIEAVKERDTTTDDN